MSRCPKPLETCQPPKTLLFNSQRKAQYFPYAAAPTAITFKNWVSYMKLILFPNLPIRETGTAARGEVLTNLFNARLYL